MELTSPLQRALDARVSLGRRRVLGGLAAAVAAPALAVRPAAAAFGGGAQAGDPAWTFRAFRKLRFAMHEQPVFWWMKATKFGLVDSRLTPLYGMEIASIFRVKNRPDGGFTAKSLEFVYTVDPDTRELLDELINPYTGDVLPVSDVPVGPAEVEYAPSGPTLSSELPGATIDSTHDSGVIVNDGQVWLRDDTSAVVTPTDAARAPFLVSDWATYHGRVADIEAPELASAPATVAFQAISSWQVRMRMGDRAGSMITRGSGAKVDTFEALPADFRALLKRRHPEIHADPVGALDRPPFRFER